MQSDDMRISYWMTDGCSSNLQARRSRPSICLGGGIVLNACARHKRRPSSRQHPSRTPSRTMTAPRSEFLRTLLDRGFIHQCTDLDALDPRALEGSLTAYIGFRSEEHTSELQSLMRISSAVFCLKKKT